MPPPTPPVDPDVGPYASEADTWNSRLVREQKALFDSGRVRSGDPAGVSSDAVKAHLLEALAGMGVEVGAYDERIITHVARFYEHSTCQVWLGLLRRAYAAGQASGGPAVTGEPLDHVRVADLDAAIEAAARHIVEGSSVRHDRAWWFAERAVTAAESLIRADERAKVRAEVAEEIALRLDGEAAVHRHTTWDSLRKAAEFAREHAADRIAPEPTSKEQR